MLSLALLLAVTLTPPQLELIGPPPFEQVTRFECVFGDDASAGKPASGTRSSTVALDYRRVDHKAGTALIVSGGRETPIKLFSGPDSVSLVGMDGAVFQVTTMRTYGPTVAQHNGWKFAAALSRHTPSGRGVSVEQSHGSCRAVEHPRIR